MCVPCGPRRRVSYERRSFKTLDELTSSVMRQNAVAKYPDNEKALAEIQKYISENIAHTEKWIVNDMVNNEPLLAYIWSEANNRISIHKYYLSEKKKHNGWDKTVKSFL